MLQLYFESGIIEMAVIEAIQCLSTAHSLGASDGPTRKSTKIQKSQLFATGGCMAGGSIGPMMLWSLHPNSSTYQSTTK